ncbi:MAG: hypothetical protein H6835_17120 [Planctomycetes bacterium]|nr:hypothetical protein [Planctomycetota bacterium]
MKIIRPLFWLVALLPLAAVAYLTSFAARLPEPWLHREQLGEAATVWRWADCLQAHQGPMHLGARALHLAALQVPGATCASVIWQNVLFAALLTVALTGLVMRAVPPSRRAAPFVFAFYSLFTCAPAYGAVWVWGERAPQVLVPLLFVAALFWLQGPGRFAGRAMLAMLMAVVAPLFHVHGALVGVALVPALLGAARRNGKGGGWWWAGVTVVLAAAASGYTLFEVQRVGVESAHWLRHLASQPGVSALELLHATGLVWLDLLPGLGIDEQALGAVSWLMVLLLPWLGDRSPAGREVAAPWWSCMWFGLLTIVLAGVRFELAPPGEMLREATYGAFLLPLGAIGLLGARFGRPLFVFGAGALTVMAAQDWKLGVEDVRLARMRADAVEATYTLPEFAGAAPETLPVRDPATLGLLRDNGWIPPIDERAVTLPVAFTTSALDRYGAVDGGTATRVAGTLRSSATDETVQWLFLLVKRGDGAPEVVADLRPTFAGVGRQVPWVFDLAEPIADGAQARVVGFLPRSRAWAALGATFDVVDGKLVASTR